LPAVSRPTRGVLLFEDARPREELVASIISHLRLAGGRIQPATGWDDHDASLLASRFVKGDLISSSHPVGFVQVRIKRRLRWRPLSFALASVAALGVLAPPVAWSGAVLVVADAGFGSWRLGGGVRRTIRRSSVAKTRRPPTR
jgi:hypothetical protein